MCPRTASSVENKCLVGLSTCSEALCFFTPSACLFPAPLFGTWRYLRDAGARRKLQHLFLPRKRAFSALVFHTSVPPDLPKPTSHSFGTLEWNWVPEATALCGQTSCSWHKSNGLFQFPGLQRAVSMRLSGYPFFFFSKCENDVAENRPVQTEKPHQEGTGWLSCGPDSHHARLAVGEA